MAAMRLVVTEGAGIGRTLDLPADGRMNIGRSPQADITLEDPSISRVHAEIRLENGAATLRDLDSSYGTFVGEERVRDHALRHGDLIILGDTVVRFECEESSPSAPPGAQVETVTEEQRIGEYRVLRLLGEGAMGAVYHAVSGQGTEVALKTIKYESRSPAPMVAHFVREARTLSKLKHPNVVQVLDAGETEGTHFIAMEFVKGRDLGETLKKKGRFPVAFALGVGFYVADALVEAERQGIVHRDLKPGNIMYTDDRKVKVCDFGLAKELDETGLAKLTKTGAIKGTVYYMPPEQVDDAKSATPKSDQYALGATLYHMIAGRPRLGTGALHDQMVAICTTDPEPLTACAPSTPADVGQAIMKMLSRNPADRFVSATAVRDVLRSLCQTHQRK